MREEAFLAVAVPSAAVACIELDGRSGRWMEVLFDLHHLDARGETRVSLHDSLAAPCGEQALSGEVVRRLLYLTAPWDGRADDFELRLEDANALRAGLIYQMRGERRRGVIRATLPADDVDAGHGLSSLLFLWSYADEVFGSAGDYAWAPVAAARAALEPNPARAYGLRNPTLRFYVEAYGMAGVPLHSMICAYRTDDGQLARSWEGTLQVPEARCGLVAELDVGALPAGSYALHIELKPAAGGRRGAAIRAGGRFQMLWRAGSWVRTGEQWLDEARLLLDASEVEAFRRLEIGQREVFLDRFWSAVDGPVTAAFDGPTRVRYRERVAHADRRFGGRVRGSQTDRGRALVRFGEPNEIRKELMPREQDRIASFLQREIDDAERGDAGAPVRRSPHDTSAYEVWYYVTWGESLFPADEPPTRGRSLEFVFVDELGNGEYQLVYTNLYGGL
ncbi:MAG: GWxTD domain-containing protein [Candidatus Eisenbacteria sp.]|nr:GWxTD domain-containing protein [Candidatus Eisenbacteria bacterium]